MTTNLLLPTAADDLAAALHDAVQGADPRWRDRVVTRLAQELRSNSEHSAPVRSLPPFAPAWAAANQTHHVLPAARLQDEVGTVVKAVARAAAAPPRMSKRDSTLAKRCVELLGAFDHERWMALAERAVSVGEALEVWAEKERWRRANTRRRREPAVVKSVSGRTWRRAESFAQVLDLGRGARWCLLKGDDLAQIYAHRFATGELTFWTLHGEDGATLALLSHDDERRLDEFKDVHDEVAASYREDVRRLARAEKLDVSGSWDVDALALDPDLGGRGQPYHEGELRGRKCHRPIRYRLWSDGRRRRYLLATGTDLKRAPRNYLRLDASSKDRFDVSLSGAVELGWNGLQSELMIATLIDAFPNARRPAHAKRAIRMARAA